MIHEKRREKLLELIREPGIDALIVSAPVNVRYLCGFTGGASYLIVGPAKTMLVSDSRFTEQIAEECPDLDAHIRPHSETTIEALKKVIEQIGLKKIGIESGRMTVAEFDSLKEKLPAAEWFGAKNIVETIRAVKDDGEVATIRRAVAAAEYAYGQFVRELQPTDSEFDLTDRIEFLIRKHGGRATSFEPITAVGPRSALAHAPATSRVVRSGEWLLVDWGAVVDGYCSDLTRILIPYTPNVRSHDAPMLDRPRLEKAYAAVTAARSAALATIRPGVEAKAVDGAARKAIDDAGFGDFFTHSLGHGIGLEIHEAPFMRRVSEETLRAGNVVTVEPGVYFPGWGGIRVEDDVVVTPDGMQLLSSLPSEFEQMFV